MFALRSSRNKKVRVGSGSFGVVYKSERESRVLAIKEMPMSPQAVQEADIACRFSREPGFIPVVSCQRTSKKITITMPFVRETLLEMLWRRIDSPQPHISMGLLHSIFEQLVEAVAAMHRQHYVHKDIKLENILYENRTVYLCDFGFAQQFVPGKKTLCDSLGSLHYAAPELWNKFPYQGPEVDIWALGVCFYALATNTFPFNGSSGPEVLRQTRRPLPFPPHCRSRWLRDLLRKMLEPDLDKRITIFEIQQHPFFVRGRRWRAQRKKFCSLPNLPTVFSDRSFPSRDQILSCTP